MSNSHYFLIEQAEKQQKLGLLIILNSWFPDLAAGGSDDWAKGVAGIRYSYTVELADRGKHGFVLPAGFIDPTGAQMFGAVSTLALDVIRKRQENEQEGGQDEGQSGTAWTDGGETEASDGGETEASAEGDMDKVLVTSIL